MEERNYSHLGETLWCGRLENGLPVYVIPKPGFQKKFAFFATNYGGMDMNFRLDGVAHKTPAGVAHFLEHKMFDTKDGNALQTLASNGASPNAFTSWDLTGYYFESTDGFYENLKVLLSFVSQPWFTQESVDKEQGIIGQEIQMIEDDPEWMVLQNLLSSLYVNHPIQVSIAGSRASIAEITADTLYECHRAFYHPGNMVLCVCGDVEPEKVLSIAREVLPAQRGPKVERDHGPAEPEQAAGSEREQAMAVSVPICQIGFKADPAPAGEAHLKQEIVGELLSEALCGASSPLYARLYREGRINKSFSINYLAYTGCALLCAGGECKDSRALRDALLAEGQRIAREGIDEAFFQRLKKASYGSWVRALNSFETMCISQAQGHFAGVDYLTFPEVFQSVTVDDLQNAAKAWIRPERTALSVIRPKEEGQA